MKVKRVLSGVMALCISYSSILSVQQHNVITVNAADSVWENNNSVSHIEDYTVIPKNSGSETSKKIFAGDDSLYVASLGEIPNATTTTVPAVTTTTSSTQATTVSSTNVTTTKPVATTKTVESAFSYTVNDDCVTITGYSGSETDVEIPASIDGLPVTSIGEDAFYNCAGLTSITIPNSVKSIGDYAFCNCPKLTSITIPESVTSIGESAFYYCTGLTSITIPESVTSIGRGAFHYCTELASITIPESVTTIEDKAFYYCTGLTSIEIPESVANIGNSAFSNCTRLTSITIPESVTSIGAGAFSDCWTLASITIPESVTTIGYRTFSYCKGLTSITIPESVTSIGEYAFSSCNGLTSIEIPESVTSIGNSAFHYCTGLTSITIPEGVTSIGEAAFYYCTELASITIENPECEIYDSAITIPNSSVIYGYDDSTAQDYALAHGNEFVSLGKYTKESDNGYTSKMLESGVTMLVNENQTDVYLIYAIDSLDYSSVGFAIECKGKNAYKYMTKAYQSIDIDGVTYKAEDFGGSYIVALHIANVGKDGLDDFNARQKTKPNNIKLDIDKPKNTKEDQ